MIALGLVNKMFKFLVFLINKNNFGQKTATWFLSDYSNIKHFV
ncbi:hypothetical protein T190611E02C_20517 [Tenacibaculum sp. 190524A05c]